MAEPRPPRIAYTLRYRRTASETFVDGEAEALVAMGADPRLWAFDEGRGPSPESMTLRARARLLPRPSHLRAIWRPVSALARRAESLGLRVPCLRDLRRVHALIAAWRRDPPLWVRAHFVAEATRLTLLAADAVGVPVSVAVHARDLYVPEPDFAPMLGAASDITTVTRFQVALLQRQGHGGARWVPCGVDTLPGRGPSPDHAFLCVARCVPKKGIELLIEAIRSLNSDGVPARLDLVGDGPLLPTLRARARGLPVAFHGALPHRRVQALLRHGRWTAFVLPCCRAADGDRDGLPVAALEAAAAGIPVLISALPGIDEAFPPASLLPLDHEGRPDATALLRALRSPPHPEPSRWPSAEQAARLWWDGLPR